MTNASPVGPRPGASAVPRANKAEYLKQAQNSVPMFKGMGATRMVESWADDVPEGKVTDFKGAVKAKPDEDVIFLTAKDMSHGIAGIPVDPSISAPRYAPGFGPTGETGQR